MNDTPSIDPVTMPVAFPVETIQRSPKPRPDMYGVVGYWPQSGQWTPMAKWFNRTEDCDDPAGCAYQYGIQLTDQGWTHCQVIMLHGDIT